MSSSNAERSSQDHVQQEQSMHGEASAQHGRSGEGAASAMAHMIQQDQKQRRQTGESGEDDTRG